MDDRQRSKENTASAWGRIRKNVGVLLSGRAIFALFNLAAVAVATRAVGLEAIGAIGLLMAFARLTGGLFKLGTWQAVLTYGAPIKKAGDRTGLRRLIGLTLMLDAAAVILAVGCAILAAIHAGPLMGWTEEMIAVAPWFMVTVAFLMQMTPVGILRLYDKIIPIASQHATTAVLRLIGASGIWAFGGGFTALAVVWAASAVIAGALLWLNAFRVGAAEIGRPTFSSAIRQRRDRFPRFWRFAGATNLTTTLNNAIMPVTTLVVGAALGPAAAGLFHLVRQVTDAMVRPATVLSQVVYPEFSLLAAEADKRAMRRIMKRALLYAALVQIAVVAALALGGGWILVGLFGPEAAAGREALALVALASGVVVTGFALEPALMSIGRAGLAMRATFGAWAVYVAALFALLPPFGLVGVGASLVLCRATQFAWRLTLAVRNLK